MGIARHEKATGLGVALNLFTRIKISFLSGLGYWVTRLVCGSLRWQAVNLQILESIWASGGRTIMSFWHGRILMATYYFRHKGIVVLTSQNRDGEYIARVIQRFGYTPARGSSSRGSRGAVVEALRALQIGKDVGLTMDGPRGPRYVAKRGAAYLARKSGRPVIPFTVSVEKKWMLRSWDHFQIPWPFSRALVLIGDPIFVGAAATEEDMRAVEIRIQKSLEELRDRGDSWWGGAPDR
jgi:lysophospholipid acyltransferase (LPLAT)-like uncharacterized protein